MNKMTGYVVVEKGFEYNDEIHSPNEGGGGIPKKIFFNLNDVQSEVKRLNLEMLKNVNIIDYAYDIEDVVNDVEEFEALINKINENHGGKEQPKYNWQDYTWKIHSQATDDELSEVYKLVSLSFYDYYVVDIDTQSFRDNQIDRVLQ